MHLTCTFIFLSPTKFNEQANYETAHRAKNPPSVTSSPLGPNIKIYSGIILHYFVYLTYFVIFQNEWIYVNYSRLNRSIYKRN